VIADISIAVHAAASSDNALHGEAPRSDIDAAIMAAPPHDGVLRATALGSEAQQM
jgi:hypothetical protein